MWEVEEYIDDYSLFGINIILIFIMKLVQGLFWLVNYIGLYFFLFVEEVLLVEIVRGVEILDELVVCVFDFVRVIWKILIVVKDDWGFFVVWVQNIFILEGIIMLLEGYFLVLIENFGVQVGMFKGVLALVDYFGLNMVLCYENQVVEYYGLKYIQYFVVEVFWVMFEEL